MDYQNLLVENIKYYRSLLGYTQEKLAEVANISKSAIGQIEIGRNAPSFKHLVAIAEALQIEPNLLLKKRDYPSDDNSPDLAQLASEVALVLEKNRQKENS